MRFPCAPHSTRDCVLLCTERQKVSEQGRKATEVTTDPHTIMVLLLLYRLGVARPFLMLKALFLTLP